MMQWDFTFEHRLELEREEGREEGRENGESDLMEVARALRSGVPHEELKKKNGR